MKRRTSTVEILLSTTSRRLRSIGLTIIRPTTQPISSALQLPNQAFLLENGTIPNGKAYPAPTLGFSNAQKPTYICFAIKMTSGNRANWMSRSLIFCWIATHLRSVSPIRLCSATTNLMSSIAYRNPFVMRGSRRHWRTRGCLCPWSPAEIRSGSQGHCGIWS
jgi:hypothetical protein